MAFSLKMEAVAALIIVILLIYNYQAKTPERVKDKWFTFIMAMSLVSIFLDCTSVWCICYFSALPYWLVMLEESLNYVIICYNAIVIASFVVYISYEHASNRAGFKIAGAINGAMLAAICAMVVYNLYSGCIFYFEDGEYYRGALNRIGYAIVAVDAVIILLSFYLNRKTIAKGSRMLLWVLPVTICCITGYQLLLPNVLMNGMIMAIAGVIIFLSFQSNHVGVDSLTGLRDRGAFMDELEIWMQRGKSFHIVFISLCEFQQENLNYGHKTGDEVLYSISQYLGSLERCPNVFRLGGVSFAILCNRERCTGLGGCISDVKARFEKPWRVGNTESRINACFCDLLWTGQNWTPTQIIERLEYGLRCAKNKGYGERVVITPELDALMERRRFVISQMEKATASGGFEVYYQPVYSLKESGFCHAEALVRLRADNGEMISPGEFIPIAEETGALCDISWIITEKVCRFMAENENLPLKSVSINLSVDQFTQPDMEKRLLAILNKYGVSPTRIKIELTERTLSENPARAGEIMRRLSDKGIGFYLDDFGVGYSNIATVLTLPLETVKLDKTLTDKVLESDKERRFISSMVGMLLDADYEIVAEGAEDNATVTELQQLGVDRIQGFYYSKPLPEAQFCTFIKEGNKAS